MKLSEVFDQLRHGELSQLHLGGEGTAAGVIDASNFGKMVNHVNLALVQIYTRFNLKENELVLVPQAGKLSYPLHSSYAASNARSLEPVKYISDSGSPFMDDILKVERVTTDTGFELDINNLSNPYSCHTPTLTTLKLPKELVNDTADLPEYLRTSQLAVAYRARHPVIKAPATLFNPSRVELELPPAFLEPLLYYIASRLQAPVGLASDMSTSNNYAVKYENACRQLELGGWDIEQGSQNTRLQKGGWV